MMLKKKQRKALIIGSGAIGAYLAKLLLKNRFQIITTSRMKTNYKLNYKKLNIEKKVKFIKLNILRKKKIKYVIKNIKPDYIYYFAGQSSVAKSFNKSIETYKSNYIGAMNFLNILKKQKSKIKFFKANSAYIFDGSKKKITLNSKLIKPESPYTKSQIKSYKMIKKYREQGLNCYNVIFFNIESPLRANHFLIKKICIAVRKLKKDKIRKINVGNINAYRDFGWAPEIVHGIYHMMQLEPCDMLLGTGKSMSIKNVIKYAFEYRGLNYKKYIVIDKKLFRKNERNKVIGSMKKTFSKLKKWKPKVFGKELVYKMSKYC